MMYLRMAPWIAILLLIGATCFLKDSRDKWKGNAEGCHAARELDRRTYEQGQREAEALNKEQVRQIEARQKEITDEVTSDLNSRLERIRRELRQGTSPIGSPPKGPGAGGTGKAQPGADPEARMCLTPEERLRAAENEERHDSLIDWVERQSQR